MKIQFKFGRLRLDNGLRKKKSGVNFFIRFQKNASKKFDFLKNVFLIFQDENFRPLV